MNLENLGVQEMSATEVKSVDGGGMVISRTQQAGMAENGETLMEIIGGFYWGFRSAIQKKYKLKTKKMKKLDITELKTINGGGFARDAGWVIGRTVGLITMIGIGSFFKVKL